MRRRLALLVAVLCLAALGVTAVALASGGQQDGERAKATKPHRTAAAKAPLGGIAAMVLDSLAGRLGVQPAALRTAIEQIGAQERQKLLQAAGLTPAETAALKACRTAGAKHRKAACDTAAAKSAGQKLKAAAGAKPDLVALKAELAQSLATKLGKTPDEILTAVRAELDQRLTQAVAIGLVTQKGHDLALACFDDPATCDLPALRAEIHFGHHGKTKSPHQGGTPPSGPGVMTPGGRSTSTPLR